jgi:drug/metabolite transporter (DMT)-like permease
MWGLVFVAPILLPEYSPIALSLGRYLAFGLVALALAWRARAALATLTRDQWRVALALAAIGNLVYYAALAAGIQAAGAPLASVIIGTLPVVIAVTANRTAVRHREARLPWRALLPSSVLIAIGILGVNHEEVSRAEAFVGTRHVWGIALTLVALAAWTWYPIRNARFMKAHPDVSSGTWATAQGLATLPLALGVAVVYGLFLGATLPPATWTPLGPRPWAYVGLMLAMAIGASWLGTLLWNRASRLLPTALAGQLIVFETLAALAYAYSLRGSAPGLVASGGIVALMLGVILAVSAFQRTESVTR